MSSNRNSTPQRAAADIDNTVIVNASGATGTDGDAVTPEKDGSSPLHPESQRYVVGNEIARGGMGAVLKGRDRRLGRDLAIKVLLADRQDDENSHRFTEEAQIGGQLQHPGIVPVYDLGTLPDGRLFFAMKLVKGRTLDSMFRGRSNVLDDQPHLLGIFEQICQTLAYAHSKSVVHRDLKPANIMVGAFGEVQVMDWGLAKVLQEDLGTQAVNATAASVHNTTIKTVRTIDELNGTDSASHTRSGSVLGTLAYMPPEQALGQIDRVDRRADVFALGAILCELVTGKPPYVADESGRLHRMAIKADLKDCFQRLEASGCDRHLAAIVKGCLAEEPSDRYSDAEVVVKLVTQYLESVSERLQESELQNAATAARAAEALKTAAAERRRRQMVMTSGVLAVAVCVAVGLGAVTFQKNQRDLAQAKADVAMEGVLRQQQEAQQTSKEQQRIRDELAVAAALIATAEKREPTPAQLTQIVEATQRARSLLNSLPDDQEITEQLANVVTQHQRLAAAVNLLSELDALRIEGIGRAVKQSYFTVHSSKSPVTTYPTSVLSAYGLAEAFEEWGLNKDQPVTLAAEKISRLPDWASPSVSVALRLWQKTLASECQFETMMQADWNVLTASSLVSRGGASLQQLDDHSILSIGLNPSCDVYELEFPLTKDVADFSALRIEALPDPDGESKGLGRGKNGEAAMTNLEVSVGHGSRDAFQHLTIESAESDYCFRFEPMQATQWNLTNAGSAPRTAFFSLDQSFQPTDDDSSEQVLRVVIHNHNLKEWGDQNLRRIRLSVGHKIQLLQGTEYAEFLAAILEQLPSGDDWQQQLWPAIDAADTASLLELAKSPELEHQPDAYLMLLAEALNEQGERNYVSKVVESRTWNTVTPDNLNAAATLTMQSDNSIIADESSNFYSDVFRLDWLGLDKSLGPPAAIRIETFDDADGGPGHERTMEGCQITEFHVSVSEDKTGVLKPVPILLASADHQAILHGRTNAAIDGDRSTSWMLMHPAGTPVCSAVLELSPIEKFSFGGRFTLAISSGRFISETRNSLRRFRVSWTYEDCDDIEDPRDVALKILRRAYVKQPANERLLLALSRQMIFGAQPDFQESTAYSTAAISLRPDNLATVSTFTQLVLMQQPEPTDALYQRAVSLAVKADEMNLSTQAIDQLVQEWVSLGDRHFSASSYGAAAEAYEEALRLSPAEFSKHERLGYSLTKAGKRARAEEVFRMGLEQTPVDPWCATHFGYLLATDGRFEEALQQLNLAIELEPLNRMALSRRPLVLMRIGDYQGAHLAFLEVEKTPYASTSHKYGNGMVLIELGREVEAIGQFETLLATSRRSSALRNVLLLLLRKDDKSEVLERIRLASIEQPNTNELISSSLANLIVTPGKLLAGGYGTTVLSKLEDPASLLELAKLLASEAPTQTAAVQRALALAFVNVGDWQAAKQAAEKTTLLTEDPLGVETFVIAGLHQVNKDFQLAADAYRLAEKQSLDSRLNSTLAMLEWMRNQPEIQAIARRISAEEAQQP